MTETQQSSSSGVAKSHKSRRSVHPVEDYKPDFQRPGFDPELYVHFRHGFSPQTYATIRERSGLTAKRCYLDLACGPGIILNELGTEAISAYGVDQSIEMLRFAHANLDDKEKQLVLNGDGHCLPFANRSLDLVTIGQAIHWFDLEKLIPELRRVIRPGGWLAILSRYPAPESEFRFWVERLTAQAEQRSGKAIRPHLTEIPGISNVIGLEGNGFQDYRRDVFNWTAETPTETFIQGYCYRAQGRELSKEALIWFEDQLRQGLASMAPDGMVVEPYQDFVITAQRQEN